MPANRFQEMKDLATLSTPQPPVFLENEPQENICLLQKAVEDTAVLRAQLLSSDGEVAGGDFPAYPFFLLPCPAQHKQRAAW